MATLKSGDQLSRQRQRRNSNVWPKTRHCLIETCKKPFLVYSHQTAKMYCSRECFLEGNRRRVREWRERMDAKTPGGYVTVTREHEKKRIERKLRMRMEAAIGTLGAAKVRSICEELLEAKQ